MYCYFILRGPVIFLLCFISSYCESYGVFILTGTGLQFHLSVLLTIYGHASHKIPANFPQFTGFKQKSP